VTRSGGVHAERDTGVEDCMTRFKTAKLWRGVRAWLQPDRTQEGFKLFDVPELPTAVKITRMCEPNAAERVTVVVSINLKTTKSWRGGQGITRDQIE